MLPPAPPPTNEAERLERLRALAVLDTAPEPLFDTLSRLAAAICGTPIALLSLVDASRQWFKANVGLPGVSETPRELAFCAHAILDGEVLEVGDACADPRFAGNPLVTGEPGIRFYAGAPIELPGGVRLGTLCVIDRQPRRLDPAQREQLRELAAAAAQALELREQALASALAARSRHEAELTGHVQSLNSVLDQLPAAVSVWSRDMRNVYANAELARWMGTTPQALAGCSIDAVVGAQRTAVRDLRREAVLRGEIQQFEILLAPPQGGPPRSMRITLLPWRAADGTIDGFVALGLDVTAEREAATLARLMAAIVDGSNDAIFGQNMAGQVTSWNAAAESMLGWRREEIIGQPAWKLFSKGALALAAMNGEQGTLSSFETQCRHKDGREVVVAASLSPIRDERGRVLGISAILRDIGPLRDALSALRESEAFLDRTGRLARIGGWEVDLAAGRIRWSPQLRAILGMPPDAEPTVADALAMYAEPGRGQLAAAIEAASQGVQAFDLQLALRTACGRDLTVRVIGEPVPKDGRIVRVAGALQDVTGCVTAAGAALAAALAQAAAPPGAAPGA
ncbi:MAG: PAS domain-containing protein [Pseudomonadota bacterium]|jgi:PAS domain S-box-containing protein|nr:PAS domain-containing protein [Rubrivivax sp.]MCA3258405.1 PAS domain-containing protein [Rubrivivax sp.]MCZ8031644.1 PAS domain-containing protein [Rubrivivax sp.]